MITAKEVKQNVRDWAGLISTFGIPSELLIKRGTPCPLCGGTDRFTYDNKFGNGDSFCRGCGHHDGLSLIQHYNGFDFPTTIKEVANYLGLKGKPQSSYVTQKQIFKAEVERYKKALQWDLIMECPLPKTKRDLDWHDRAIRVILDFRNKYPNYLQLVGI